MTHNHEQLQRITTLRPYSEVLGWIRKTISETATMNVAPALAVGATYAADVVANEDYPSKAIALHDGWAVASELLTDASAYSPANLATMPYWVNAGQPIPPKADAVLPVDAVADVGGGVEVYSSATPGEGISLAGSDVAKGDLVCEAGRRVQQIDLAILRRLGIKSMAVRFPNIKIVPLSVSNADEDVIGPAIVEAARANGANTEIVYDIGVENLSNFDFDAAITIGQTGSGKNDRAVKSLTHAGTLAFHGVGLNPGQTAAIGSIAGRPVLMLPGRLDAAMAVFLAVGKELIEKLTGAKADERGTVLQLAKKVSSTIGLAEVVFVRRAGEEIVPLGSGVFPLQSLLRADGWILIPEGSEGVPAGANVEMKNLR